MKILGGILGFLALAYLALCFVGPTKVEASRSTEIEAPASAIFSNVSDFKNWEKWMPWYKANPDMKLSFNDQTAGVGAEYSWASESAGNGSMKIVEAEPGKFMKTEIEFDDMGTSYGSWAFEKADAGKTKVTWGMNSPDEIPFIQRGIVKLMNVQGTINGDFDKGLASLKEVIETHMKNLPTNYDGFEIKMIELPETTYIGVQDEIAIEKLQSFYASSFGAAMGAVQASKLEMKGMPTGCFYSWDEKAGKTDLLAGIPVSQAPKELAEGMKAITIPAGKALQIDYYGDYSGSVKAHEAMAKYFADRGFSEVYPVTEEYVTDPTTEEDMSKWLTKVTYKFTKG